MVWSLEWGREGFLRFSRVFPRVSKEFFGRTSLLSFVVGELLPASLFCNMGKRFRTGRVSFPRSQRVETGLVPRADRTKLSWTIYLAFPSSSRKAA